MNLTDRNIIIISLVIFFIGWIVLGVGLGLPELRAEDEKLGEIKPNDIGIALSVVGGLFIAQIVPVIATNT